MDERPEVGDIAHIKPEAATRHHGAYGLVSKVRPGHGGEWAAELLIDGERRWLDQSEIDQVLKERNPFRRVAGESRVPCRLFVLLARDAPAGVIIRRGPARWVQLIKWNTTTDSFEPGQWLHGRLYELRADLSPDGTKLIYFATKMSGRTLQKDGFYAWTAISKPPYLTALALWPKQMGAWFGGGLFQTDTRVELNHLGCEAALHPDFQLPRGFHVTARTGDPRYETVFYQRLQREGWRIDPAWWQRHALSGFVGAPRARHEKRHRTEPFVLIMVSEIFSLKGHTYTICDERRGEPTALDGVTWADWDHQGRLVYAKEGKLFAAEASDRVAEPRELADFNAQRPEPIEAADWAKRW